MLFPSSVFFICYLLITNYYFHSLFAICYPYTFFSCAFYCLWFFNDSWKDRRIKILNIFVIFVFLYIANNNFFLRILYCKLLPSFNSLINSFVYFLTLPRMLIFCSFSLIYLSHKSHCCNSFTNLYKHIFFMGLGHKVCKT